MQLQGKTAVVTGGTAGIGLAIAKAFVAAGASVVISGRDAERGEKALAAIAAPDRAAFVSADCMVNGSAEQVIDVAIGRFGRLDVMVNNAGGGVGLGDPTAEVPDEVWDTTIKWNLYSTFWGSRAALRHMIPQGSGRIVNMSSIEGKHGKPGLTPYVAAKHAINGLTKATAKEVAELGITVNALCPGIILTDAVVVGGQTAAANMGITFDEMIGLFTAESAVRRPITVEEVAAVAVFLASDSASGVTGALWSIDGGTAAH
jgi:3-hydroxybutyrate dehydrogenase